MAGVAHQRDAPDAPAQASPGRSISAHLNGLGDAPRSISCRSACQPRKSFAISSWVPRAVHDSTCQSLRSRKRDDVHQFAAPHRIVQRVAVRPKPVHRRGRAKSAAAALCHRHQLAPGDDAGELRRVRANNVSRTLASSTCTEQRGWSCVRPSAGRGLEEIELKIRSVGLLRVEVHGHVSERDRGDLAGALVLVGPLLGDVGIGRLVHRRVVRDDAPHVERRLRVGDAEVSGADARDVLWPPCRQAY